MIRRIEFAGVSYSVWLQGLRLVTTLNNTRPTADKTCLHLVRGWWLFTFISKTKKVICGNYKVRVDGWMPYLEAQSGITHLWPLNAQLNVLLSASNPRKSPKSTIIVPVSQLEQQMCINLLLETVQQTYNVLQYELKTTAASCCTKWSSWIMWVWVCSFHTRQNKITHTH